MNKNVYKNFVKNLVKLRKEKGLSQRLLSEFLGCDSSYMSKIENFTNKPSLDKAIEIADFFKVELAEMFK